jgi:hypothetical protein
LLFESENWHFNFGKCYLNSKNLFDLKIDIWILNYSFQIWKLVFQFKKNIESKNRHFDFKYFYLTFKFDLNFEVLNLNLKKLFDLKVEIWIPNYYFGFSKLIFQFRKLLIES